MLFLVLYKLQRPWSVMHQRFWCQNVCPILRQTIFFVNFFFNFNTCMTLISCIYFHKLQVLNKDAIFQFPCHIWWTKLLICWMDVGSANFFPRQNEEYIIHRHWFISLTRMCWVVKQLTVCQHYLRSFKLSNLFRYNTRMSKDIRLESRVDFLTRYSGLGIGRVRSGSGGI